MIILSYTDGIKRIELQQKPMMIPTSIWNSLDPGTKNILKNVSTKYMILIWDNETLESSIPSNAWQGTLNQFRVQVQAELGIDVPDHMPGKNQIVNGQLVAVD